MELDRQEEYPAGPLPPALAFDKLLVEKSLRRLTAFSRGKPVRVYLVALGHNPVGPKEIQGDKRTPEGVYHIDGKNAASAYYKNLGISYPNEADRARAKALNAPPGGDIKIHGLAPEFADIGSAHRLTDWTYGCIAVTNEEMEELFTHTPVGASVEIRP
jgi:murein L,D-transpeptidase YafK